MVECQLPKLDVAGSTPVSRSIFQSSRTRAAKYYNAVDRLRRWPLKLFLALAVIPKETDISCLWTDRGHLY